MAATTIYFNGRLISVPGSYSEVDASGLEPVNQSATGIVACLGTAVGGMPYTAVGNGDVKSQLQVSSQPQQPFNYFRSGHLREAAPVLFGPANDEDIPGGAQEIVHVKVNPATQSEATFSNSSGDCLKLTSEDYGYFTTQINVEIGAGTNQGKLLTLTFEDTEEAFDDVGGDNLFTLQYLATTPSNGYTTITATISASALYTEFTLARAGLDSDISNQITTGQKYEFVSDNAGDTTQTITVYGTNTSDAAQWETLNCNGTTVVESQKTWNSIHGVLISAAPAGTVTVSNYGGEGTTITTLDSSNLTRGLHAMSDVSVASEVLSVVRGTAGTERLTFVGKNSSGGVQHETVQLNGTTAVQTTGSWSELTYIAMGEIVAEGTVTTSAKSVNCPFAGLDTLQKCADKFNGTSGYTFTVITSSTAFSMTNFDYVTATDVKSPAEPGFKADLYAIIEKLNLESELVTASRVSGGTGAPDNTTAAVYLSGGHEGSSTPGQEGVPTASNSDWQAALDLLKRVRVNTIVVMTHDTSVHAMVKAHCQYMGGVGRSERDAKLGFQNAGLTGLATKTEIKSQLVDLNSKYIAGWAQNVERYNTSGEKEVFPPMYGALIVAGMQAGSPVGTPTTHKYMNALSLEQDSSWNPAEDAEEMVNAGLTFGETVDGVGRRIVRGVTSYLVSANLAFGEQSVVEATNNFVYNHRTTMEREVGKAGFAGTAQAAHTLAINNLTKEIGVSLVAYRSLSTSLTLDVIEQSMEVAPVLPVNFVKSTVHLVTVPQSASA